MGSSNLVTAAPRINTVAFGHSADSALDFRCHLKQLADVGQVLSHVDQSWESLCHLGLLMFVGLRDRWIRMEQMGAFTGSFRMVGEH